MAFMQRSEYDRGVNTFSPEGRLFQVEYAIEAIKLGSTAVGIQTKEGVVLAVEKKLTSPLVEPGSIEKIMEIDKHIGCASSGLAADARTLVDHARVEAQHHWFTYNEGMPIESCINSIADLALDFSDSDKDRKKVMSRPFGVALLVGGIDPVVGPVMFYSEPSGTYTQYKAFAIGGAQEKANSMLQEKYTPDMSLEEAKKTAMDILRQVMEEKLSNKNVELAEIVKGPSPFRMFNTEELSEIIRNLPAPTL